MFVVHSSHTTRGTDASSFDEICTKCFATDRRGCDLLTLPCPAVDASEHGGRLLQSMVWASVLRDEQHPPLQPTREARLIRRPRP